MKVKSKRITALLLSLTLLAASLSGVGISAFAATDTTKKTVVDNVEYRYTVENKEATLTYMKALDSRKEIKIASKLGGYPVRTLAQRFFTAEENADFEQRNPKVKTVVIPNSVKTIKPYAFQECIYIKTVKIGKGVTKIGKYAFFWCVGLKEFAVNKDNKKFASIDGNLVSKHKTILYKYPSAKTKADITLSRTVKTVKTDAIYPSYYIKSINFNNVEVVEPEAVQMCTALETMKFGKNLKSFSPNNYYYNTALKSITVSSENKHYSTSGGVLFNKKKTTLIYYPNKKSGTKYTIPKTVKTLGANAFYCNDRLKEIVFPSGLEKIGRLALFELQKVESVNLKNTKVTEIGNYAFDFCPKLSEIKLPETLKTVGIYAFSGHIAKNIVIPKNVETLGKYAFFSRNMETIKFLGDKTEFKKSSIGTEWDSKGKKYYVTTIIAHKGSNAHELAEKYNIPFEELK